MAHAHYTVMLYLIHEITLFHVFSAQQQLLAAAGTSLTSVSGMLIILTKTFYLLYFTVTVIL